MSDKQASETIEEARRQLECLARNPRKRVTESSRQRPTRWTPNDVVDPETGMRFTDAGAWFLVAERLKSGEPLERIALRKPEGSHAYVMQFRLRSDHEPLYIKLEQSLGKVIGRSFHYSEHSDV